MSHVIGSFWKMIEPFHKRSIIPRASDSHSDSFHHFLALPYEIRIIIWNYALSQPRLIKVRPVAFFSGLNFSDAVGKVRFPKLTASIPPLLQTNREAREFALKVYETCLSTEIDPSIQFYTPISRIREFYEWQKELLRPLLRNLPKFIRKRPQGHRPFNYIPHSRIISKGIYFQPSCDTLYFDSCDLYYETFLSINGMTNETIKTGNIQSIAVSDRLLNYGVLFLNYLLDTPADIVVFLGLRGDENSPLANLRERILVCEDDEWKVGMDETLFRIGKGIWNADPEYTITTRSELQGSPRWGGVC